MILDTFFCMEPGPATLPQPESNTSPVPLPSDPQAFYNQADDLIFLGRLPVLLLGLGLAMLVFLWAREWFGLWGGLLALALFCFDPNFIAHSGLVTTDVGVALFMFGTIYFLWRICRRLDVAAVVLFLLFFALAFVTKFSAVLLLPLFWLTVLGRIISPEPLSVGPSGKAKLVSRTSKMALFAGLFSLALLGTYATIWASYSFRYSAAQYPETAAQAEAQILGAGNPASRQSERAVESRVPYRKLGYFPIEAAVRGSAAIKKLLAASPQGVLGNDDILKTMDAVPLGLGGKLILFAQKHHVLPEAYLYGFAHAEMKNLVRASFLLGKLFQYRVSELFFLCVPAQNAAARPPAHPDRVDFEPAEMRRKARAGDFSGGAGRVVFSGGHDVASQHRPSPPAAHLPVSVCSGRRAGAGIGPLAADHPHRCPAGCAGCHCVEQPDRLLSGRRFEMADDLPALSGLLQRTRRRSGQRLQGTVRLQPRLGTGPQKPETLARDA